MLLCLAALLLVLICYNTKGLKCMWNGVVFLSAILGDFSLSGFLQNKYGLLIDNQLFLSYAAQFQNEMGNAYNLSVGESYSWKHPYSIDNLQNPKHYFDINNQIAYVLVQVIIDPVDLSVPTPLNQSAPFKTM